MRFLLGILICLFVFSATSAQAQEARFEGNVSSEGLGIPGLAIQMDGSAVVAITDSLGNFAISDIGLGQHYLLVNGLGYEVLRHAFEIESSQQILRADLDLTPSLYGLDQAVITGTKTFKRQTDSPVIVNIMDSKAIANVQACNLSEALKFQTGLRVETNCQTCNYTQLRMNGLAGGYSQILINGRPIFSPLTGLYGLEQIPSSMIDRIETIRGGGSSLYGSSAVGGTVNVITKIPQDGGFELDYSLHNINGGASDSQLSGNGNLIAKNKKSGISFFLNNRQRQAYDHNGDNFSELPELSINSFGSNFFFLPTAQQKIEVSLSSINEYRYGGQLGSEEAHLAEQSEERTHNVLFFSADYQINSKKSDRSLITYVSGQRTLRDHYTGIIPDVGDSIAYAQHLANPPYGDSETITYQGGLQVNQRINRFLGGNNVITAGAEYVVDDVLDRIEAYNYLVDQQTQNLGVFAQSDWEINPQLNLLSGVRFDTHNLVDHPIISPRVSLLYKWKERTQVRLTYSTGFRAPQAFDSDLHIAFAGGGISRISLSPDLVEERSQSLSGSINWDKATDKMVYGYTVEAFHTYLRDAFFLQPLGEDAFGERFEKRNGTGATVQGITLEGRANFNGKLQVEAGATLQASFFDQAVDVIEGLAPQRAFLRTPNEYGFLSLTLMPSERFNGNINLVYTGPMTVAHFAGAPERLEDGFIVTDPFLEVDLKCSYSFPLEKWANELGIYAGAKNALNAYQNDFDTGKNRDSNFVYGPALPRTVYVGITLR